MVRITPMLVGLEDLVIRQLRGRVPSNASDRLQDALLKVDERANDIKCHDLEISV
jgi:hypothetical protein